MTTRPNAMLTAVILGVVALVAAAFGQTPPAQQTPPGQTPPPPGQTFKVGLPGKDWTLAMDLPGFLLERQDTRPDGATAMLMAHNDATGMTVFAYVTREPKDRSVDECKRHYWGLTASSPFRKDDVHQVTKGEMLAVHFVIPELQGRPIRQKNVIAYLYRDGTCMDVHLTKGPYDRQADEPLFSAVLDSIRIVPGEMR
ncbi:MAG TPA: hypothetical protein VGS03_09705 [Candidatus Polarisedimenticolia bacterium]|nr:hypothetical protein [Candidatus Polarisedimenticolia bacterium]